MNEASVALYIHQRRWNKAIVKDLWLGVENGLGDERMVVEREMVEFLWDIFYMALEKVTKQPAGTYHRTPPKQGAKLKALQRMIPWVEEAKINPFSFFLWAIEQRRAT